MSDDQHEYLPASTTANTAEITVEAPARASPSGMVPRSTVSSEAAELIAAVSVGPNPTPAAAPATTTLAAAPEQAVSMVRADSHRGSTSGEAIAAGQLHAESRHLDERKPWRSTHGTTGSEMQVDQDSEYTVGVKDHSNSRATSSERSSARIEQQLQMSRHYHEGQRAAPGEDSREQGYERHHAMHAAGDTAGRSPSLEATNVGPSSVGADVRSSDDMRMRSGSTTSLTNQAQFTFSSPLHRSNPTISTTHRTDNTPGHQRAERHSVSNTPGHYGHTPEYTTSPTYSHQAEEEDIRMSESPSPDDDNDNDNDNDDNDNDNDSSKEESYYHRSSYEGYPGDYSRSSVFRRSAQQQGYDHEQGQQDESRSSLSPSGSASHGQSQPGGVTMPAKSAVLYHAGYNSGRGAVWRFFKVVEARVSGNTDRAECLLCKKRMLGKSADMKKHIVISCPNRREISEDMRPILEIVKAELDNPKKRAKRNSNTPIVLHADGTFGPDTRPSHGYQPESSQMVSRTHGQPGGQNMPGRFAPQVRAAPYDFHSDPLRAAKMAKYGRGPMRSGGGGSHMESGGMGPGGQGMPSEHSMRYSPQMHGHPHSAMPIPVQQGQFSRPHSTQPGHPPRIRSPVHPGGFQQRHGGPPLPPQVQLPAPAFPTSHQGPSSGQQGPHSATRTPPQQQNVGQGPPGQALQPPAQQQGSLPTPRAQGSGPARLQGPPPGQPPVSFYPGAGPQGSQPPVHQPQPHQAQHGQGPHSGAPGPITSSSHGLPPPPPQQQQQQQQHQQHQQQQQQQVPPPPGQVAAYSQSSSPRAMTGGASYNRLKQKLQQRVPVFGVWLSIPSPMTARMLATQGFDWACIDMEHSPTNPTLMAEMVAAVASSGTCTPIVRLPSHSPEWFKWALDAGAHGVIVPMVNTPEEMHNINKMCRYPPHGKRTMGAFFAPSMFNLRGPRAMIEYVERASRDIMVIPQIESAEGVANLPSIVKVGGMDALFVGPYDLSASVRASQDMQYREALGYVEKVAQDNELPIGIYASSGSTAFSRLNDGYTLLVAASDIECLSSSAAENLERARGDGRQYR